MCGIIAFSGKAKNKFNLDKLQQLIIINQYVRGEHSFGYYTSESGLQKTAETATKFLEQYNITESNMIIAHVRQSTIGTVSKRNAHPFKTGNIVSVHNGTLSNHYELFREYGIAPADWNVDSEIFSIALNKDKNPEIFSKVKGPMAVVFTDITKSNIMYVYRNDDRPLYYGYIDGDMYISSLSEALSIISCSDIEPFEIETLYTIKNGKITNKKDIVNFGEYYSKNIYNYYTSDNTTSNVRTFVADPKWMRSFHKLIDKSHIMNLEERAKAREGEYYFCKGEFFNKIQVDISNSQGSKYMLVDKAAFVTEPLKLGTGDYLISNTRIYPKSAFNKTYADVGDELCITKVYYNEKDIDVEVHNTKNPNILFNICLDWVTPLLTVDDMFQQ